MRKFLRGLKYCPKTGNIYGAWGRPIRAKDKDGYIIFRRTINKKSKKIFAHRAAFAIMGVDIPKGHVVDHINSIKNDNTWSNLRILTHRENVSEQYWHRDGTKVKYITWSKSSRKYRVKHKRNKHIAYCDSIEEAKKILDDYLAGD